jgi:hypothetical protein
MKRTRIFRNFSFGKAPLDLLTLLLGVLLFAFSCASPSEPVKTPAPQVEAVNSVVETAPEPQPEVPAEPEVFDPLTVSQEEYDSTKVDIQGLIKDLNRIIRNKNYNQWIARLDKSYFDRINSEEFLAAVSSQPSLKNRKIVLRSAKDYFLEVVVPSRANDRVDDIDFITHTRVKAYTIKEDGIRLRLYDLENFENGWKIIN